MTRSPHGGVPGSSAATWLCLLVLLAAVASSLVAGGARSASSPQGLIAFARYDGIYVMRGDGRQARALRRGGEAAQARSLAWSPDGSRLAFVATDDAVWVMNADGSGLVRVLEPSHQGTLAGSNWSPTWLPNGRQLAVTVFNGNTRSPDRDIWVVNVDGSGLHRLLQTPHRFEREIDWSPVGGRIAFTPGGWFPNIFVMSANGTNVRQVTHQRAWKHWASGPDWSPDGRRIVYTRGGGSDEIFVVNVQRGSRVQLTRNSVSDFDPAWSSDGTRIVFVRNTSEPEIRCANCPPARRGSGELYVMNADGTGVRRLTKDNFAERSPTWQPAAMAP